MFSLTSIGLNNASKAVDPEKAYAPYIAVMKDAGRISTWILLIVGGLLVIAALLAKLYTYDKAPSRLIAKFMDKRSWYHTLLSMAMGTILVPLAIWFSALRVFHLEKWDYVRFGGFVLTYVLVGVALYWLKLEETSELFGNISWTIDLKGAQTNREAEQHINDLFKEIVWLKACETTSTSTDGTVVLEVPIGYALRTWPKEKVAEFSVLFDSSTEYLKKKGFKVEARKKSFSVSLTFNALKIKRLK